MKRFLIRGEPRTKLVGRTSFDWASIVGHHYAGRSNDIPGGALNVAKQWVEHNQEIFGREDVVLVVFGEEGGWNPCPGEPTPSCMFGQEPRDQGAWNIVQLQNLAARNSRVKREHFTNINLKTIEFAFKVSHETGCIFEWCVDATLKHDTGLNVGSIDHIVRQTASYMRELQAKYTQAAFVLRPRNEWKAHQGFPVTLKNVNMWATRMYRWKKGEETRVSFSSPGDGWVAEQWPEVFLIVDRGGGNTVAEDIGPEPGKYKMANIHIARKGEGWDWRDPVPQIGQLRTDARGQPVGSNENMFGVSMEGTLDWYRNVNGRNVVFTRKGLEDQMLFYSNNVPIFDYFCVHDDIGKKANAAWNPDTKFEAALAEFFGGSVVVPPPTESFRYAAQIQDDWDLILGHPLKDEATMRSRNEAYRLFYEEGDAHGMSKAQHQDLLLRSDEFKKKNPGGK